MEVDVRYVGFDIPTDFVVGYGLDYNERYRDLPFVGLLGRAHVPLMSRGRVRCPSGNHGPATVVLLTAACNDRHPAVSNAPDDLSRRLAVGPAR